MKSNLLNKHFLKTGESLSLATCMKSMGGQNEPIIEYFQKTSSKTDDSVSIVEENCKKSDEDMQKHEALLEGIVKDYQALYFMNKQLNGRVIVLKKEYFKGMLLLEDKILQLFT